MTQPNLGQLVLECGDVSAMEARVCARLAAGDPGIWQLAGHVRGPHCQFARTLPATISFRPSHAASGAQGVAVVPDPCLWTPQLPMIYDVHVELRRGEQVVEATQRSLAIRVFGPRGPNLNLAGKRWVLRGVRRSLAPAAPLAAWREAGAAMLLTEPDEALAVEAARLGVPLVALIRGATREAIVAELLCLARCPAVLVAAIDAAADLPPDIGLAALDIRLAAYCHAANVPQQLPRWASLLLCESHSAAELARAASGRPFPVVAMRPEKHAAGLLAARQACDVLQRDLAPHADVAGYVV